MSYSVDINEEYKKSKSRLLRYSLLFSLVLAATLVADTLLVVFSKENYTVNLVIAIVITSLFGWFAIYFFTNIYRELNTRYRYFKGYESGVKAVEEVQFLGQDSELHYVNGLYVYPIHIRSYDGLKTVDKTIYVLNYDLGYKAYDRLTITTYQRILIESESHS